MTVDVVYLYYPNRWRSVLGSCGSSFNWFLCSSRQYDDSTKLHYISVSNHVQFFCPSTGKSLAARGLSSRGEGVETKNVSARLVILSDVSNKRVLCKKYDCGIGCDSNRDVLSTECELVVNIPHTKELAERIISDYGFDGVVVRHDCVCDETHASPVCHEATFYFRDGILEDVDALSHERCGIIQYAKKHNTYIRRKVGEFPTNSEIDEMINHKSCRDVSKILYEHLKNVI